MTSKTKNIKVEKVQLSRINFCFAFRSNSKLSLFGILKNKTSKCDRKQSLKSE